MALADSKSSESVEWAAITGVIATVSVFAIAQGLSYPLLSFILQGQGVSPAMIGLSAAMTPVGFILSSPLIPALARRFGAGCTALTCAALSALVLALVGWTQNVYLWFPLRFLIGVVTNPLYVLSEIWVIALAPPARRGRVMGIYSTIISAGFAAGPLCLLAVGTEGWPPFLVGIGAFLFCGGCLAAVVRRLPKVEEAENKVSVLGFIPMAWLLLSAVIVAAGFEQAILALLPVYGTHYGIPEARMSALLSVMIAGNIAMQVPLGLLAERLTARLVRFGCVAVTILGCVLLPALIETPLIWVCVFVWGAVSYGIYTMSIIELGERFTGSALVAGNAAFSLMWGFGGILVPPLTGGVMDVVGAAGLPVALGAICAALAAATIFRRRVV
ncbi:MFS transporter [Mesorhizobium sp. M2D.F.Ca.ET.185.01.1.1]|uniref:MFS transporter n=1 Tax=unclassified Mesorhizobium TaxID=325217 RepID=UPI000FCCD30C|nr:MULTISPECIES: MFS transporter [unclassified Mesorhizobium]TGP79356.1 MFS transporter [bacterium M00.F.Ca.ET.227.01.1.1]TGQ00906.1 MFS transporter [bacterium M00.F.Ca.ET.221.01.1.1]TGQ02575.1 MFS transporter [bacterium M00.F.Ca.ET.222.01.1.1]TGU12467.1 MFS transporter [bacterium M00.F.Ca.ET.163.01.1.1]TGU34440.1 MFS transporter [bacterium M00.F.Ca.ET.156.01.1.1]TGU46404.1 MFS transporter [bacterium M00.F.Ca.ET.146.01.1.1]TGV72186.1 MFS transporter [Mesorhizobium sp. M2D.F.Ca.ET.160.01.1.1]